MKKEVVIIIILFLIGFLIGYFNSADKTGTVVSDKLLAEKTSLERPELFMKYETEEGQVAVTTTPSITTAPGQPLGIITERFEAKEVPRFKGYIIQFKDEPIAKRKLKLERLGMARTVQIAELSTYRRSIEDAHVRAKKEIEKTIGPKKILNEYKDLFNGLAMDISSTESEKLKQLSFVESVSPNYEVKTMLMDSVPLINADDVWSLDADGNQCAQTGKECLTGKGISIAIIDTGVDYTHPDLGGCFGSSCKVIDGYDFVNLDNDPIDDNGHGTHVAATAAGNGALKGVAPDANIYAYKVLNNYGSGWSDDIIIAIERAQDPNQDGDYLDHVDVISMSLGGLGDPDGPTSQAVDNAVDNGIVVVVAAGNSGSIYGAIGTPGTARKAITVGATDKYDKIASFSSRGPVEWVTATGEIKIIIKPDIVAPGMDICAAQWDEVWSNYECYDTKHIAIAGTSMATPHVSGATALLKQAHPDWTPQEIKLVLRNTAVNLGYDINTQGYGRIDALKAVQAKKPPFAQLDTSGLLTNLVDIVGTATADNFKEYTLSYGEGLDPTTWTPYYTSTRSISNGVLVPSFDPTNLADGDYTLRLTVTNANGVTSEDRTIMRVDNIQITSPLNNDIFRAGDIIEIKGIMSGQNYNIEYGLGYNPIEWSSNGIGLVNDGIDLLATWDTSSITKGDFYTIRIRDGQKLDYIKNIYLDPTLKKGWPQRINFLDFGNYWSNTRPIISDIDNDGLQEIIVYSNTDNFYVSLPKLLIYNYDGSLKLSVNVDIPNETGNILYNSGMLVSADVDNDGSNEIVLYSNSKYGDYAGYVFIFNHDGSILKGWPVKVPADMLPGILVADLDMDGNKEIIVKGNFGFKDPDRWLTVIGNNGNIISQVHLPESWITSWNLPAIGNFDSDMDLEIVIADQNQNIGNIHIYNLDGSEIKTWQLDGRIFASPVTGDINNDGFDEIIIGLVRIDVFGGGVYVFDKNGGILSGWPALESLPFESSPSLADIDYDRNLEIIISTLKSDGTGSYTYILKHDGTIVEGWPQKISEYFCSGCAHDFHSIVIGDVDNDFASDIIIAADGFQIFTSGVVFDSGVYIRKFDGTLLKSFLAENHLVALTVTDLDNDKKVELIGADYYGYDFETKKYKTRGTIYVWELEGAYNPETMQWPQFHHDAQRTGLYIKPCTDTTSPTTVYGGGTVSGTTTACCPDSTYCAFNGNCIPRYDLAGIEACGFDVDGDGDKELCGFGNLFYDQDNYVDSLVCTECSNTWNGLGGETNCFGDDADDTCTKPTCVIDSDCGPSSTSSGWVCVRPGTCLAECRQYWIKEEKQSIKVANDGYVFLNSKGTLTKSSTGYLAVGPRNNDCFKFRSWLDFDISTIPDNAKITDVKLFLSTHYMDNPQNRLVIITKIDQNQSAMLMEPSTLWNDIGYNWYTTLTDFTSTAQESWKTQGIDLSDSANLALQEKLPQDLFSVGVAMPDESCVAQLFYRPTHAYLDFFNTETGYGPILKVTYSA